MALTGNQMRNDLATQYGVKAAYAAVCSTAPTATAAGTEPSGGAPAYARKPLTWSAGATGVVTSSATHDIPSGFVAAYWSFFTAVTAGTYEDGGAYGASQTFSSQGTLASTFTFTES